MDSREQLHQDEIIELEVEELSEEEAILSEIEKYYKHPFRPCSANNQNDAQAAFEKANVPKNYTWEEVEQLESYNQIDKEDE